jgi:hypothetical protein
MDYVERIGLGRLVKWGASLLGIAVLLAYWYPGLQELMLRYVGPTGNVGVGLLGYLEAVIEMGAEAVGSLVLGLALVLALGRSAEDRVKDPRAPERPHEQDT